MVYIISSGTPRTYISSNRDYSIIFRRKRRAPWGLVGRRSLTRVKGQPLKSDYTFKLTEIPDVADGDLRDESARLRPDQRYLEIFRILQAIHDRICRPTFVQGVDTPAGPDAKMPPEHGGVA